MIRRITVENFTVFDQTDFEFSENFNVIIGENSTGKSHLLKLIYALSSVSFSVQKNTSQQNKESFQRLIADKLMQVFKPDSLGRLVTRKQGSNKCRIKIFFDQKDLNFAFTFSNRSKTEVSVEEMPVSFNPNEPLFLPTREVISLFPKFTSLYKDYHIEFDETYYDLCLALDKPLLKGRRFDEIKDVIQPIEKIIGGQVEVKNGRFYLKIPQKGNLEIHLIAEGLRKLAMLVYLILNGSLKDNGLLFWDEPESNLNPRLIKEVVHTLNLLTKKEIQVFVATHSLFFLRELEILFHSEKKALHYFSFSYAEDSIRFTGGNSIEEIEPLVSLDEELEQSDRFLEIE